MGKARYTSNGTFTPVTGVTTYNFVVIGGGGGCYIYGNGGNGGIVKATYTNITNNLNIIIGGAGLSGGNSDISYSYGGGGGLTQVIGNNINIVAGGGGGGGFYYKVEGGGSKPKPSVPVYINGGDGCYYNSSTGGPGQGGVISGLGGHDGLGGKGGTYIGNGGDGGAYNNNGNGFPGGTVPNCGGGGGGAGSNGITGSGGSAYRAGGSNGGGGGAGGENLIIAATGGGGGGGYGGGGGGGSNLDNHKEGGAGGAGGAGGSIALLDATNVSYYTAPDPTYGNYGKGDDGKNVTGAENGYVEISWEDPPISNICFPAGTPIDTDQGLVFIEELDTTKHSINGELIQFITKTVTLDKYLIRFEKDSIKRNVPNKTTIMTKDHQIMYNGLLVPAYRFLDMSSNIKKVEYNGEILYNVLLNEYSVMKVNNLICETLHPDNGIALLYRCGFSEESKQYIKEISNRRHIVKKK